MYLRKLTVQPSDASCRGQIKLHKLLDYLQDTASMAVSDLEGASSELMARGYAWVLVRYEVEVLAPLPTLDDPFVVGTFHDPEHGYNTLRTFQVTKPDGTMLAWAKTSWLLLDLASGRPVRPMVHIPRIAERYTEAIDPDFRDIPAPAPDAEFRTTPWPIRFHDLDVNGHVNNAVYFEWVYEATPLDLMEYEIREISASFRSGARWGDRVNIETCELPSSSPDVRTFVYRVVRDSTPASKPMTLFSCTWERIRS